MAIAVSWLATRILVAYYQRKRMDAEVRIGVSAILFTVLGLDLLLFRSDLLNRDRWLLSEKGGYLWYMFPIASTFFLFIAGFTSAGVILMMRKTLPPKK